MSTHKQKADALRDALKLLVYSSSRVIDHNGNAFLPLLETDVSTCEKALADYEAAGSVGAQKEPEAKIYSFNEVPLEEWPVVSYEDYLKLASKLAFSRGLAKERGEQLLANTQPTEQPSEAAQEPEPSPKYAHQPCDDCDPSFIDCWTARSKCRKKPIGWWELEEQRRQAAQPTEARADWMRECAEAVARWAYGYYNGGDVGPADAIKYWDGIGKKLPGPMFTVEMVQGLLAAHAPKLSAPRATPPNEVTAKELIAWLEGQLEKPNSHCWLHRYRDDADSIAHYLAAMQAERAKGSTATRKAK